MTTSGCGSSFYADTCPQQVPVTLQTNNLSILGALVTINRVYDESSPHLAAVLTIQLRNPANTANLAQRMKLDCIFAASPTDFGKPVANPPTNPGWREKALYTDANGTLVINVQHDGPPDRTWYLIVDCNGVPKVSDAISLGAS